MRAPIVFMEAEADAFEPDTITDSIRDVNATEITRRELTSLTYGRRFMWRLVSTNREDEMNVSSSGPASRVSQLQHTKACFVSLDWEYL